MSVKVSIILSVSFLIGSAIVAAGFFYSNSGRYQAIQTSKGQIFVLDTKTGNEFIFGVGTGWYGEKKPYKD